MIKYREYFGEAPGSLITADFFTIEIKTLKVA